MAASSAPSGAVRSADIVGQAYGALFRDERLSFRAKGVFGLLCTNGDGHGVTAELLAECSTDGVSAVRAALRELEEFGYLVRERSARSEGSLGDVSYAVSEFARSAPGGDGHSPARSADHSAPAGGTEAAQRQTSASRGPFLVSDQVQEVLLAFPGDFREAIRAVARTDRPRALVVAVERELRAVGRHRLAERVRRRWVTHGYARLLAEGTLKRPVGAAVALVKAGPCPDPRCEDGRLEDGAACRACGEREKDRRAGQARRRPESRQGAAGPQSCPHCGGQPGADGELCGACARSAEAVREEIAGLVDAAVRDWAAVPGVSAAEARAEVEHAVARARMDAAEAGAALTGQALAARLAALEEGRRAWTARNEIGAGDRAGLPAIADRPGH
ncbi:hypothetical protein [Streptomyces sp. 3N207]|uniref:hypothetical protein n=1 Tax=Streptomyces sp. 3N207 TaxID=3457417 RepID=UPI003FCFF6C0